MRCMYCDYEAKSGDQLHVHQNRFHERLLALDGDDRAEEKRNYVPVCDHPEWPPPQPDGIGFVDCVYCGGAGMVYSKAKLGEPLFGKAIYCPKCYPALGLRPRGCTEVAKARR